MADSQYDQSLQERHTHDPAYSRALSRNGLYGLNNRWPFPSPAPPGPGSAVRTAMEAPRAGSHTRDRYAADNMRYSCLDLA